MSTEEMIMNMPSVDGLTHEDVAVYGNRWLDGYSRVKMLGRGGCAVVWLAERRPTGDKVAIKQVAKCCGAKGRADIESAWREINVAAMYFDLSGRGGFKIDPLQYPGVVHIARLLEYHDLKRDLWLVFDFAGASMSKVSFKIQGTFFHGERIYNVIHMPFYKSLQRDIRVLKRLLRDIFQALELFWRSGLVHGDLKPDNILLITPDGDSQRDFVYQGVRIIDFGSAYRYHESHQVGMATPEYMPPEALQAMGKRHSGKSRDELQHRLSGLVDQSTPWSFDTWAVGAITLELCVGVPLWLSYKARVEYGQGGRRPFMGMGHFAVTGKDNDKMVQKQRDVVAHLRKSISESPGIPLHKDTDGMDLLTRMLAWQPDERISPTDALSHPFLAAV